MTIDADTPIPAKKYRNIVRAVFDRPWAILPEKYAAIRELVELRSDGGQVSPADIEAATGGRRRKGSGYTGRVAVIELFGVLAQRMGMMEQMSGGTSTDAAKQAVQDAAADPTVSHIVLHVDSPGGDVFGTQELAEAIYAARSAKPVVAVIDSLGASAAYWIASAASEVVITPSGMTGSVGVVSAHVATQEAEERLGVKTTILRVPDGKAEGAYGEAMSEDAVRHRMAVIEQYYGAFVESVAKYRGTTADAVAVGYGQGRTVTANDALRAGMVDRIATFDAVMSELHTGGSSTMSAQDNQDIKASDTSQHGAAPQTVKATAEQIFAAIKVAAIPSDRQMELAASLIAEGVTFDGLLARVAREASEASVPAGPTRIDATESELDKFRAAARDALVVRHYGRVPQQIWSRHEEQYVAPQHGRDTRHMARLPGLASECLVRCGYSPAAVQRLSAQEIARIVMGGNAADFGLRAASDGPAYNVSGMFSNVLLDAANVVARQGYDDTRTTFQMWMRQADSLPDFKQVHAIVSGELGDPQAIPEDGEFSETTMSDSKESYRLTTWGSMFSLTWQMMVNDQLGEFMKVPAKMGASMRRKQNRLAYGVIKDNPTMADTGALFNSTAQTTAGGHANLTTGAGTPTVANLNTLTKKMMEMKGLDTSDSAALNLMPRYIITCPALRGTVLELLASTANPAAGGSATGSSGVANIWQNGLEPIIEAELGAAAGGSDTAWYLATDWMQMEHIEYAYLQGLETPALEEAEAFDRLAKRYRIYQAFAVHPVEYRGLQKHAGA